MHRTSEEGGNAFRRIVGGEVHILASGPNNDATILTWNQVQVVAKEHLLQRQCICCCILITLLNDMHLPISAWYVVGAYPVSWSVKDFKADQSEVAIETIKLHYKYFKTYRI